MRTRKKTEKKIQHKITGSTDHKYLGLDINPSLDRYTFDDGFEFIPSKRIVFIGGVTLVSDNYIIICQEI